MFILIIKRNIKILMFQRYIIMRRFYISYKHVKMTYLLPRSYAVICGRLIIAVNWDYPYAPKQDKLASIWLQRFSSIKPFNLNNHYLIVHNCECTYSSVGVDKHNSTLALYCWGSVLLVVLNSGYNNNGYPKDWPRGNKIFYMLNLTDHVIYHAHKF